MRKKQVLAFAILLSAMSISTQSNAAERLVVETDESKSIISEVVSDLTTTESGGAVFAKGNLDITDSEYLRNSSTGVGASGGAIFVDAKNKIVNISDSKFEYNEILANEADGSAVSVKNGLVNINNTDFRYNKANWGTVYQYASQNGNRVSKIDIDGSLFEYNEALDVGGVGIFNEGEITNTTFRANKATSPTGDGGGAIFVGSEGAIAVLDNVIFEYNTSATSGGAIGTRKSTNPDDTKNDNSAGILNITNSTFTGNEAATTGGAIDNYFYSGASVSNSTFEGNSATQGGALFNHNDKDKNGNASNIDIADSSFSENTAVDGGAIYAQSDLTIKNSSFNKNSATDMGGAVQITGGNILIESSEFKENEAATTSAIANYTLSKSSVTIKDSLFDGNIASDGGAVGNWSSLGMTIDNTRFENNKATGEIAGCTDGGAALFLGASSVTEVKNSVFENNYSANNGGAIATRDNLKANNQNGKLDISDTTFKNNESAGDGGAIYNAFYNSQSVPDNVALKGVTFENNKSGGNGGAIYNEAADLGSGVSAVDITDASFINNSADGIGGAIYANGNVTLNALNEDMLLSGNTDSTGSNDIFMEGASSDLDVNIGSDKSVTFASGVSGNDAGFDMNVAGGGTLDVQSAIKNAAMTVDASTLHLNDGSDISGVKGIHLTNESKLDTTNNQIDQFAEGIITTDGSDITVSADVNMNDGTGDDIGSALKGTSSRVIISEINSIATGATSDNVEIDLYDLLGLTDAGVTAGIDTTGTVVNDVMTPIRRLSGSISNNGMLNYNPTGNGYNDFNPAVMASSVAAYMGGYLNQLNTYDQAFRNMDMYMLMTKEQRQAMKYANKYAVTESVLPYQEPYALQAEKAGWFNPYGTFESVRLDGGPKVSNVAWGSFAGLESGLLELGNGWDGLINIYAGYNGSHQAYQGNSIYQNGGTLGVTGMAYKGNFFTALTANIGANVAEADTMFGSEDFSMLMTGIASKSGYNYEFADGKFIIQPSLMMAYSMVNTFDYTNAANVRIDSNALHAFTFEPGVKFIGNLANGWQPYAGVSVVMNALNDANFKANDTALPELSVKPYAKYGVGVRKTWGERLTGFIQAFVTSGGRDGVGFQGGFRWQLGKKVEKVQQPTEKKYVNAGTKQNPII